MLPINIHDKPWLSMFDFSASSKLHSNLIWVLVAMPAVIAMLAMAGWILSIPTFIQVRPDFVPMQFNTALGFLLSSIAIAGLLIANIPITRISLILLALLTLGTLLQYLLNINLGIDELFMDAYNTTRTAYPGRMASATAICFQLIVLATLLYLEFGHGKWALLIAMCTSSIIVAISMIALVGYYMELTAGYGFGISEMALHTASCFLLLGCALSLYATSNSAGNAPLELFQRIALAALGTTSFALIFMMLQADQRIRLQNAAEAVATKVHSEFINQDNNRNQQFRETAQSVFTLDEAQWKLKTSTILESRRSYLAASVSSGSENYAEAFSTDQSIPETLILQWHAASPGTAWQFDDRWYYKYAVKGSNLENTEAANLTLLLDLDSMLNYIRSRWMNGSYSIQTFQNSQLIGDFPLNDSVSASIEVAIMGRNWDFKIAPTSQFIRSMENSVNTALLIVMALFLLTLLLMQNLYFRARSSEETSRILNSRLSESLDAMLDAVVICNERGIITEVNSAALDMFGYETSQLIGKNVNMLVHGSHRERHDHYVRNSKGPREGLVIGTEGTLQAETKSGKPFPVTMRIKRGQDNRGERMFIAVIHDLSDIALAESHRALLDATLNATMDTSQAGWAVIDTKGVIQQVNKAILDWLGYKEEEILGKPIAKIYPPEDHAQTEEFLNYLKSGKFESLTRERRYLTSGGDIKWGLASKSSVQSKQENPFIVYQIIDITQQKQLQQDLVDHIVALEKSNSELDQFAYVASHDLKSPLNAIAKLSNWIEEDCADILPVKAREYLGLLHARVNRLTHLLDDLLIYSRVGKQKHEYDYINLEKLSRELLDLNSPDLSFSITATNIDILVPTVPFELVLRNLISNAIKHHHEEQGIIEVYAEIVEEGYKVQVSDNGPGIPEEYRDKAVQMFQTLKSRDKTEGSGMGLAICKKTVEYYGGQLFIETSPLGGTTITIMWPIGKGYQIGARMHEHANHPAPH